MCDDASKMWCVRENEKMEDDVLIDVLLFVVEIVFCLLGVFFFFFHHFGSLLLRVLHTVDPERDSISASYFISMTMTFI